MAPRVHRPGNDDAGWIEPLASADQEIARIVQSFTALIPAPGLIGAAQGYNNAGHAAILATFTDRTVALLELTLP